VGVEVPEWIWEGQELALGGRRGVSWLGLGCEMMEDFFVCSEEVVVDLSGGKLEG
jgi:hypothetical protein